MFKKRQEHFDSAIESWIMDYMPDDVTDQEVSALMIFLEQFFTGRDICHIISDTFETSYEYLFGAFEPYCEYKTFLEICKKARNHNINEIGLEMFSLGFQPIKEIEKVFKYMPLSNMSTVEAPRLYHWSDNVNLSDVDLTNFWNLYTKVEIAMSGKEFVKPTDQKFLTIVHLILRESSKKDAVMFLWHFFGSHQFLLRYYVDSASNSLL
jgi:hypothetical protein